MIEDGEFYGGGKVIDGNGKLGGCGGGEEGERASGERKRERRGEMGSGRDG